MPVRRLPLLVAGAVGALSTTALAAFCCCAPAYGLGLGISTPSVTLSNFAPGMTATGLGTVTVSGVLAPWTLTVADSVNAGHLVRGAVGCSGSETQTANALSAQATGAAPTTTSAGTVSIGSSARTVATGTVIDTVNVNYSLVIGRTEQMLAGCLFSTTVTLTVQ